MGILFSCCRKKKIPEPAYKKVEEVRTPDLEGGGGGEFDDDEEWDDFDQPSGAASSPHRRGSAGSPHSRSGAAGSPNSSAAAAEEEEPEPEPDPFAGFDMAPKIAKTKRHNVQSVFAKPAVPASSVFAMSPMDAPDDGSGDGWGDADLGDDLGLNERRRAAEERREARRKQREAQGEGGARGPKPPSLKGMAVKVAE